MGVQAVVVPEWCGGVPGRRRQTHQNQMLVFRELQKGTEPKAIIEQLSADPAFQTRQFGIVDLLGRSAGHSGLANGYVSQDIHGQVPGTEIFYSIQGNILRPGTVVPNAVQAFLNAKGAITDRVMAEMEAADGSGDSRCTARLGRATARSRRSHVREDCARRLHPDGGEGRHQRRFAQQRQRIHVSHRAQPAPDHGSNVIREGENLNP
jgi:hypothetical protein